MLHPFATLLRRVTFALASVLIVSAFAGASSAHLEYSPGIILVRADAAEKLSLSKPTLASFGLTDPRLITLVPPRMRPTSAGMRSWYAFEIDKDRDPLALADSLADFGYTAQPNYRYRLLNTPNTQSDPNDPRFSEQWAASNIGLGETWQHIQQTSRDSVIVAIIDTGIDYDHPDLAPRMWRNIAEVNGIEGVDDDGNGYVDDFIGWDFTDAPGLPGAGDYLERDNDPMDANGHGTAVAGIIGAEIDNGIGIAGAAPIARLMALRAGAELEFGGGFLEEDDIAAAVVYAVENGARVVNMSFGDVVSTPLMHDIVRYAENNGVVVVASAGNERTSQLLYPAAYDETIAVGSIDEANGKSHFTSWGENIDLVAPGSAVLTTRLNNDYGLVWGTSFSGPYVAAACANLLSYAPHLTPTQVRTLIRAGTIDIGPPGWDPEFGAGRLHLPTLLAASSSPVAEILSPQRPDGADSSFDWSIAIGGAPPIAWDLSYGVGSEPRLWTKIAIGASESPVDTVFGNASVATVPETTYVVRLTTTDALERQQQDRTVLTIDHTAPVFVDEPVALTRWRNADPEAVITWKTDDIALGKILVQHTSGAVTELVTESEDTTHTVLVPTEISRSESNSVIVMVTNRAGLTTVSEPFVVEHQRHSIPQTGFEKIASLPAGVLLPDILDVDLDGFPEIGIKPSHRAPYDSVSFYEIGPNGTPSLSYTIPEPMRPVAVADLNRNSLREVIGIDHLTDTFRVTIVEQQQMKSPPYRVVWRGANMVAPSVADTDGDGLPELITLREPDRTQIILHEVPQWYEMSALAEVASLSSANGTMAPRFGIWRAVGDFDGNGRQTIVVGTESGDIYLFHNLGDNTYSAPEIIHGTGDATRVWGGVDITGDGLANYAVLRYHEGSRFSISERRFELELYGNDSTPILTHELADARTDGTGLAIGDVGPNGSPALVFAIPPRLYVLSNPQYGIDGLTWFSEVTIPSQPLVADLTNNNRSELVIGRGDSLFVMRRTTVDDPLPPPRNVTVTSHESTSLEISWTTEPNLEYRVWTGSSGSDINPVFDLTDPTPPVVLGGFPLGASITVAVQAIDRSRADSLGVLSELQTVVLRHGPMLLSTARIEPNRIDLRFDKPLDPTTTTVRSFRIESDGVSENPSSFVMDRSETRVILTVANAELLSEAQLVVAVRDTGGASSSVTVPVPPVISSDTPVLTFALATSPKTIRIGFSTAIDEATLTPSRIDLVGGPGIDSVNPVHPGGREFELELASDLAANSTVVLEVHGVHAFDGIPFSAAAIVSSDYVDSAGPVRLIAVLQAAPDTLWLITTKPLDIDRMSRSDVVTNPRVRIQDILAGPLSTVTIVAIDPTTPIGPWEESYSVVTRAIDMDGEASVLEGVVTPTSGQVFSGRLVSASQTGPHSLRLVFDVLLAPVAQQPDNAIRVEPGLSVTEYSIQDSVVSVGIADSGRIGPWGMTYFVHVRSLKTVDGEELTELFGLQIEPPTDFEQLSVFPQPFLPAVDSRLVFGGLPQNSTVRIYNLNGGLVRALDDDVVGGLFWDGTNEAGESVASGVYLYIITSDVGRRTGKIAVVR